MSSSCLASKGLASLSAFGASLSSEVASRRIIAALERRVLTTANPELRMYFERMVSAIESPYGLGNDDAISSASDADLEQTAILLCHYDLDQDGRLSPVEFAALADLIASQTGSTHTKEHVEKMFIRADIDESGFIDLNEYALVLASPHH